MSGDPFLIRVMTIFINVTILEINVYIYIYVREGKKGREKGKGKREGKREGKKGRGKGNPIVGPFKRNTGDDIASSGIPSTL